jgi:hypothetical protein
MATVNANTFGSRWVLSSRESNNVTSLSRRTFFKVDLTHLSITFRKMLARRKPRCGFCLKEFSKSKDVQLHIANTPKCRAARAAQNREIKRRSASPVVDRCNSPNPPELDPMMVDNANEFAGPDELDYIPRERLGAIDDLASNRSQSVEVEDEDAPGRYAEDYNPENVAHILRKSLSDFETLKDDQNKAGLAEKPWAPFEDEGEWELARFLIKEVSQTATNKYLKLPIVSGGSRSEMTIKLT